MDQNATSDQLQALSMWKYSLIAFAELFVINIICHAFFKIRVDTSIVVGSSFLIGGAIALLFAKSEKRAPLTVEIYRFLLKYGAAIFLLFALTNCFVSYRAHQALSIWVYLNQLVYLVSYLFGAYLYLSNHLGKNIYRRVLSH